MQKGIKNQEKFVQNMKSEQITKTKKREIFQNLID